MFCIVRRIEMIWKWYVWKKWEIYKLLQYLFIRLPMLNLGIFVKCIFVMSLFMQLFYIYIIYPQHFFFRINCYSYLKMFFDLYEENVYTAQWITKMYIDSVLVKILYGRAGDVVLSLCYEYLFRDIFEILATLWLEFLQLMNYI